MSTPNNFRASSPFKKSFVYVKLSNTLNTRQTAAQHAISLNTLPYIWVSCINTSFFTSADTGAHAPLAQRYDLFTLSRGFWKYKYIHKENYFYNEFKYKIYELSQQNRVILYKHKGTLLYLQILKLTNILWASLVAFPF